MEYDAFRSMPTLGRSVPTMLFTIRRYKSRYEPRWSERNWSDNQVDLITKEHFLELSKLFLVQYKAVAEQCLANRTTHSI